MRVHPDNSSMSGYLRQMAKAGYRQISTTKQHSGFESSKDRNSQVSQHELEDSWQRCQDEGVINMSEATAIATSTEMKYNFGRYLQTVMNGGEVIITRNGKEVGRFDPRKTAVSCLTDSLTGILKECSDSDQIKAERLKVKYEGTD